MELDKIRKDINAIDGHVQQVGAAIEKLKAVMRKLVDAVEFTALSIEMGYIKKDPGSPDFMDDPLKPPEERKKL